MLLIVKMRLKLTASSVVPLGEEFDPRASKYRDRILRMLRVRNRFDADIPKEKLLGGYRDINLKMEIGFAMTAHGDVKFLPCEQWKGKDSKLKVRVLLLVSVSSLIGQMLYFSGQDDGRGTAASP